MKPRNETEIRAKLTALGPLKRYTSMEHTGIALEDLPVDESQYALVDQYRARIAKALISKNRRPTEVRATEGYRIDSDDALSGESECFRLRRQIKPAPIKIGINVSAYHAAWEIQAVRGAAVLAFTDYLKKIGRRFTLEVCYGNGINSCVPVCHVRVPITPHNTIVSAICLSDKTCSEFGIKLVKPLAKSIYGKWRGTYRIHEFESTGIDEFDFVLDRIETSSPEDEYQRVIARLEKIGVI